MTELLILWPLSGLVGYVVLGWLMVSRHMFDWTYLLMAFPAAVAGPLIGIVVYLEFREPFP